MRRSLVAVVGRCRSSPDRLGTPSYHLPSRPRPRSFIHHLCLYRVPAECHHRSIHQCLTIDPTPSVIITSNRSQATASAPRRICRQSVNSCYIRDSAAESSGNVGHAEDCVSRGGWSARSLSWACPNCRRCCTICRQSWPSQVHDPDLQLIFDVGHQFRSIRDLAEDHHTSGT